MEVKDTLTVDLHPGSRSTPDYPSSSLVTTYRFLGSGPDVSGFKVGSKMTLEPVFRKVERIGVKRLETLRYLSISQR